MGTTVVFALVLGGTALVANVGDCRGYLFRAGALHLLPHDHSLAQYLLDTGMMAAGDPRLTFARQQLLQHLGIRDRPVPSICKVLLAGGDRLLLCSDGLTDMLPDREIADVLRDEPGAAPACTALVDLANLAGGRDNVTVVLVDFAE
jgi:protein phosphatase